MTACTKEYWIKFEDETQSFRTFLDMITKNKITRRNI